MAEILVVQSKVKELIKGKGCNTAGEVTASLSKEVERLINKAIDRAKSNGRKTVKSDDV